MVEWRLFPISTGGRATAPTSCHLEMGPLMCPGSSVALNSSISGARAVDAQRRRVSTQAQDAMKQGCHHISWSQVPAPSYATGIGNP